MIVFVICLGETEWRSIPFFQGMKRAEGVLKGQFLFCLELWEEQIVLKQGIPRRIIRDVNRLREK